MNLEGNTVLITGGNSGIGRALAEALHARGNKVIIAGRRKEALADTVRANPGMVSFELDVTDPSSVATVSAELLRRHPRLNVLINNAGIGIFASVESMSVEDFRAVLETNVFGVFYCCHEAIPLMKRRGGGYIINISSLAGANPHAKMAAYNASKFGLNGFSEALMQEVRHDGIKVSYIMPGSVNTEFGGDEPSEANSWQLQPDDVAKVVMDLLEYPDRALPSRIEIRPSRPPKR